MSVPRDAALKNCNTVRMYPDARCLDGSKGAYYMYHDSPPSVTRLSILISHIH